MAAFTHVAVRMPQQLAGWRRPAQSARWRKQLVDGGREGHARVAVEQLETITIVTHLQRRALPVPFTGALADSSTMGIRDFDALA